MAIMEMLAVGVVAGLIAHLILRENGYAYIGEILIGSVGSIAFGMVYGIYVGMRTFKPEVLVVAAVGAVLVEAVVVYVSIRPAGDEATD